jgi:hypothetical protein
MPTILAQSYVEKLLRVEEQGAEKTELDVGKWRIAYYAARMRRVRNSENE